MNRRQFLRGVAFASLAAAGSGVAAWPARSEAADQPAAAGSPGVRDLPAPAQASPGRLLRGTPDGKVVESTDGGGSWRTIANFGSHCAVTRLSRRRDELVATVALQGHTFDLRSADGRLWRTTEPVR